MSSGDESEVGPSRHFLLLLIKENWHNGESFGSDVNFYSTNTVPVFYPNLSRVIERPAALCNLGICVGWDECSIVP